VPDTTDNCSLTVNPGQEDGDGDAIGTARDDEELPTGDEQCKNGGWQLFYDANDEAFKNQGDCVSTSPGEGTRLPAKHGYGPDR
jgi:hypothetical protein